MAATGDRGSPHSQGVLRALAERVWRRAFSPLEAFLFEKAIAPALAEAVGPTIQALVHGPRILDVGCGGGLIARSVAAASDVEVIGIDPSSAQVRRCRRRHRAGGAEAVLRARAEALPFPEGSFDSLYSSCAWKHWVEPADGVAECVRVTRRGGVIVIIEIDSAASREDFRRFAFSGRVPVGMRRLVVWFTMKTVLAVAPNAAVLEASFEGVAARLSAVSKVDDLPFLLCVATVL